MAEIEPAAPLPWWLSGGSERCPRCLQLYLYEVEVRCVSCDGPLCPLCSVELSLTVQQACCGHCREGEES
jgi:hypothetical protein